MKISNSPQHKNLNFNKRYYHTDKMFRALEKDIGESMRDILLKNVQQASAYKNSGLIYDAKKNIIEITKEKPKVSEKLLYPVKKMPLDIINAGIDTLKKVSFIEKSSLLNNISNSKLLKLRKLEVENASNIASIEKCLNSFDGKKFDSKFFQNIHSRLSLKAGNYDSANEKALTRLCTGIVPAFFLANDAYNLSMYVSNDKQIAENAHKRRFKQELTRIGITSMSMLLALKSFSKKSNKSADAVTLIITGVTVLSEIIGRKLAGNPCWFITKKSKINKYAKKRDLKNYSKKVEVKNNVQKNENPLTFKNLFKLLSAMLFVGFCADKASKLPVVNDLKTKFLTKYNNFLKKDYKISKQEFSELINLLKKNGFDGLAKKYADIAKKEAKVVGEDLLLSKITNKAKYVPIHQVLTFPVRYAWSIVNFPYSKIVKPFINKHNTQKTVPRYSDLEVLANSLNVIKKAKNKSNFSEIINKKLLSSLDYETKSSVSNAGLSIKTKKVASIASSTFLIADNYNAVMIESGGENKDLAVQKGKERAFQRIVRIIYGTFFTTLFNTVFETTYNSSLLGAQVVNVADSLVLETMERKAVGLPTKKSNRNEIISLENKYLNSKGIKGNIGRLMAKITGKKPITQRT